MLHQCRRVYEPECAVAESQSVGQLLAMWIRRADRRVTDAFSGQRQVLGVGVDDDCVFVVGEDLRVGLTIVDDTAVGFVANQKDLHAQFPLSSVQKVT